MTRIAQVANFVTPQSGGIRTVLAHLAAGYAGAGHEVLQVVPGAQRRRTAHEWGHQIEVPGTVLPGTGYRVMVPDAVWRELRVFAPERLEVHDRATLRGLGARARREGIGSCVVSHERLDRLMEHWTRGRVPTRRLADASNRRLAAGFDTVVCTTPWAAEEFERLEPDNLRLVPLGVDHERFHPRTRDAALRHRYAPSGGALLVMAVRLSAEKRAGLGIDAVRELVRRGHPVRLVVAGDGPLRRRLERAAAALPVTFLGHLPRARLAALLATADVALAPGPVETFGLAALEALACGTAVVANERSALPSVLGAAGYPAAADGAAFADAVERALATPAEHRSLLARSRALEFDWARTVQGFLAVHGLAPPSAVAA